VRFFLFGFILLTITQAAWADADDGACPAFSAPVVTLTQLRAAPQVDRTHSLYSLRDLAKGQTDHFSETYHESPVGLTAATLTLDANYKIMITEVPPGPTYCAQIANMDVRLGFNDTTVYIAREVQEGTCGFREVLAHESRHVATDESLINEETFPVSKAFEKAALQIGVVQSASKENAQQQVQEAMDSFIKDTGHILSGARKVRQARIDTPEEYKRLSSVCSGQLGELIGQYYPQ